MAVLNLVLPAVVLAAANGGARPGLVAMFRDDRGGVAGVEPTIAFSLKTSEAPRPEIDAAKFSVTWTGTLDVLRPGRYEFGADGVGTFELMLDGKAVLSGKAALDKPAPGSGSVELSQGKHELEATFVKTPGQAARVRVWWAGPDFGREPLRWQALSHDDRHRPGGLETRQQSDRGRFLIEELSCVGCHQPAASDGVARGLTSRRGPNLSKVGERARGGWIDAWLGDPQAFRKHAVMPTLFADDQVAQTQRRAATAYLVSLGSGYAEPEYKLDAAKHKATLKRGETLYRSTGCIVCHGVEVDPQGDVGADVIPIGRMGAKTYPTVLKEYLKDPAKTDPSGRMPSMSLSDEEAMDLAWYLCSKKGNSPLPSIPPEGDLAAAMQASGASADAVSDFKKLKPADQLTTLGRFVVRSKNCMACHDIQENGKALEPASPSAPSFSQMAATGAATGAADLKGCLAPDHQGAWPVYELSADDREAIQAFLAVGRFGANSPAPTVAARMMLKRFRCIQCHEKNGEGGLDETHFNVLSQYGHAAAEDTEAVSPPPLTGVGAKLRPAWLHAVLTAGARARPWMSLRMPQFGAAHVGDLAGQLAAADGVLFEEKSKRDDFSSEQVQIGRRLIGSKGFSCITCHDMAGHRGPGSRGPDLAGVKRRIQYDWWKRWLMSPQRIMSATRMPTFFPDGDSPFHEILDGDIDAQMDAMWAYLSLGQDMPLPAGVGETGDLEIVVDDKPRVFRAFVPGAGWRGIAVGYPQGIALAFDAQRCRLTQAWTGGFIDATGAWEGRGGTNVKLLGPIAWTAPQAVAWMIQSTKSTPATWPGSEKNTSAVRFRGYALGDDGPTFKYELVADANRRVAVTDHPVAFAEAGAVGFSRRFEVTGLGPDRAAWFLAGGTSGDQNVDIRKVANQSCVILPRQAGKWTVYVIKSIEGSAVWERVKSKTHHRAVIRVASAGDGDRATVVLYTFLTQRIDDATLSQLLKMTDRP